SMVTEDAFPALSDACSCGSWSRRRGRNDAGSWLVRFVASSMCPERLRLPTRKAHLVCIPLARRPAAGHRTPEYRLFLWDAPSRGMLLHVEPRDPRGEGYR